MSQHSPAADSASRRHRLWLALAIVIASILAYLPSLPGEFIWDDDDHVTHNQVLRDVEGLGEIWILRANPEAGPKYIPNTPQYYPLAFTALWLEFQRFGVDPLGYRLVNLMIHIVNALLVWALFKRIGMRGAWLVGALFALHPMHVETTAWVMEIKNLLSAFFYLLAAIAYLRFDERWAASLSGGERARSTLAPWLLAAGLFLLALLAKTITCTLPAALVLALLFQRKKLSLRRVMPLLPLLAMGIAFALVTAFLEHNHVGAQGAQFEYSLAERALIASRVFLFYPFKLLVPWPNLFVYPRWQIDPSSLAQWWSVAAVLAIAAWSVIVYRRGRRGPALALAFFAGSVLPASGLVTYYPMLFSFVADHFNYLPSLGILALLAGVVNYGVSSRRFRIVVSTSIVLTFGALTAFQSSHFATAEALYRHTLAHNPDAWLARAQLAQLLLPGGQPWKKGADLTPDPEKLREAERLLRRAIELKEDHPIQHYNLALSLLHQGRYEEGLPPAQRAVELAPRDPELAAVAAVLSLLSGELDGADEYARRALELDPENYKALQVRGDCLLRASRMVEARPFFVKAVVTAPTLQARQVAQQKLIQTLRQATPAEALGVLDEIERSLGALPFELALLRSQALAGADRLDQAIALVEAMIEDATRRGASSQLQVLRRQLDLLRRASNQSQ